MLIKVYAEKVPSREIDGVQDVLIWRDKERSKLFVRFQWFHSNKPDRRFKYVTLNCYRWRLVWL